MTMKTSVSRRSAALAAVGAITAVTAVTLSVAGTAAASPEAGAGHQRADSQVQHNERVAVAFLDLAFNKKQPEEAADRYVGDKFIQHNPLSADGTGPFIA
jgi:hypothetical protein